jgi:Dolichyl-phosphate-mannose-protein mannosyltransferase
MKDTASPENYARATAMRQSAFTEERTVVAIVFIGFMLRLYLSLTSYCIAGDGAAYIGMAREFATGTWRDPLGAVFSPLYPLLIAGMHYLVPDWEMAGNLVSTFLGTGAILSIYLLMREVFGPGKVALGAAALTAVHPQLAAYSASVRTEAGYICLTTTAVWLLLRALREDRPVMVLAAGFVAGAAYLYRTEAIGLIVLGIAYPIAAALGWHAGRFGKSIMLSLMFATAALTLVVPYVLFLHAATGSWSIGREFTAAMMFGLGSMAHDPAEWRRQGFALEASPLVVIVHNPWLYLAKVRTDLVASFYNFGQAGGPLVTILLIIGCWTRGRRMLLTADEAFLVLIVMFYFFGFALSYTGARFMIHLIPYTLGWVVMGIEVLTGWSRQIANSAGWQIPTAAPAVVVALILLPQAVWPIGYDMRGVRYAGDLIAARNHDGQAVVASDGRVAWYARAPFVGLPLSPVSNLCDWLATRRNVGYLLIGTHDERRFAIVPNAACLQFLKRYPRYGTGYYDLFAIRHEEAAH